MNKIKELRVNNKKTQIELSKLLGISQSSYQSYETGFTEPKIENLL